MTRTWKLYAELRPDQLADLVVDHPVTTTAKPPRSTEKQVFHPSSRT